MRLALRAHGRRFDRRRTYDRSVAGFANAPLKWNPTPNHLAWLAGLLEAEGTFLRPPPSMPNCPIVSCRMTDRDVVERVGAYFGTTVMAIDKGRYRTEYAATLKGGGAVDFMTEIRPLMGRRRQQAIDAAIKLYKPPQRKLDFGSAEEIRRRFHAGESVSSLARSYSVARQTIHPILQGHIYRSPPSRPWRNTEKMLPHAKPPPEMSVVEFHWLAGWLEGEGSFLAPPPSDLRRPRISAKARDKDVMAKVGRLLAVKPIPDRSGELRNPTWSTLWRVLLQGSRASRLMLALEPMMGRRRQTQIRRAITATTRATKTVPQKAPSLR